MFKTIKLECFKRDSWEVYWLALITFCITQDAFLDKASQTYIPFPSYKCTY